MSTNNQRAHLKTFTSSLSLVATSYSYRCDAKFADTEVLDKLNKIKKSGAFRLGDYLPSPLIKGIQPDYLDQPTDDSIPVISTLAIQSLSIIPSDCRHITKEDYDNLNEDRKIKKGDVLLTVDGGVSIGKACLFTEEEKYTIDSHVVVLRPKDISPLSLVYLLASPLGQMQFRRAESGASGQTTVTEDDIRRFIFPKNILGKIHSMAIDIEKKRAAIRKQRASLDEQESKLWVGLDML